MSKTSSVNRAKVTANQAEVMRHRVDGKSFREIAELTGISRAHCHRLAQAAMEELQVRTQTDAEAVVALELGRLDVAVAAIMLKVREGHMGAIDRLIRLSERRTRLLGVEGPTKIAPTSPDGATEYTGGFGLSALLGEARRHQNQRD